MRITRLRTNHIDKPLGFDLAHVLLSWTVEDCNGHWQTASQIQVACGSTEILVFDSGRCETVHDESTGQIISGMDNLGWELPFPLNPRTRYFWRVAAWTDTGESAWSDWTWFETAKAADEPWMGRMIASSLGPDVHPIFFHTFRVLKPVCSARLYCYGLGVYEAYLNHEKVGDEVLMPGLHAYDSYLQYQTLELMPVQGENTIAFAMGDGWFKGRYGLKASSFRYG